MSSTSKIMIHVFLIITLLFSSGCQKVENSSELTKEQVLKETLPIIQSFLNAQYEYLIDKDKTPQWDKYLLSGGDELKNQIDTYRDNLYYNSSARATAYTSKIIFSETLIPNTDIKSSLSGSGDTWTFKNLVDDVTLTQPIDGVSRDGDVTAGVMVYNTIIMQRIDGKWMIKSFEEHGIGGDTYRWYITRERFTATPEFQTKATTYNRANAKAYAVLHWNSPDSRYPDYTNYGGDCTNFVSQCLEAGNWAQTSKVNGRGSSLSWFHDQGYSAPPALAKRSTSWTAAASLYGFLLGSSRVNPASYPYTSMQEGDVIQLSNSTNGVHHSMIVTTRTVASNGTITIKVSYRNAGSFLPKKDFDVSTFSSSETKICWSLKNSY